YSDTEEELIVFVVKTGYSLKLPDGSRDSVVYLGMVKDGVFTKERGLLDWLRHNGFLFKGKNYHFDKYGIYRVRASRQDPSKASRAGWCGMYWQKTCRNRHCWLGRNTT
ncbi:MAG: hypothetical protein IIY72_03575, partial [Solobacterium sp.]|nr:hypothetical protein [Solobacterium sp.]